MNGATIRLNALSKRYDGVAVSPWAVRDVSATVQAGEVTMLMGPSGSGKTTLLSLIGGLLAPTSGGLHVCGRDLSACDEAERQRFRRETAGFVFQSYNLLAALTARENVEVALAAWRAEVPGARVA
jgi:putative ABC transport system ATP-binding protein